MANTRAGSVAACRRAKLATPLGGRIEKLMVREGDRVKAGQLLLELWNEDLVAREGISRDQLESALSRVREACVVADNALREAARARKLRDQGFISEDRVDRAESDAKARAANCESARAQAKEGEARIGASRADTARTVMRAPFAGIVAEVNGELGEYLTPSPPGIPTLPAIDLIDDSCLYVTAPIDEVDAASSRSACPAASRWMPTAASISPASCGASRPTCSRWRSRRAPWRSRSSSTRRRGAPPAGRLQRRHRDRRRRARRRAAHPDRRPDAGQPRPGACPRTGCSKNAASKTGLTNWEFTEIRAGLKQGERVVASLERAGVKEGARAVEEAKAAAAPGR